MNTVFIHSELEAGKSKPEEDSVEPDIKKVWKQEEQIEKNGRKKGKLCLQTMV